MSEGSFSGARRIVWHVGPDGRGAATFEYAEGVCEEREMSPVEARVLAEELGLVEVRELHEWVHLA